MSASLLCIVLFAADQPQQIIVDGFVVEVTSATTQRSTVGGRTRHSAEIEIAVSPREASDDRRAGILSKTSVAPSFIDAKWAAHTFPRLMLAETRSGGGARPARKGTKTRITGSWQGDDRPVEVLERIEGELVVMEMESQSWTFEGADLRPGGNRTKEETDLRLYCFDHDPIDDTIHFGVRLHGFNGFTPGRITHRSPEQRKDDSLIEGLATDLSPHIEMKFADGAVEVANGYGFSGGTGGSHLESTIPARSRSPKSLKLKFFTIASGSKRISFRLENVRLTEKPPVSKQAKSL